MTFNAHWLIRLMEQHILILRENNIVKLRTFDVENAASVHALRSGNSVAMSNCADCACLCLDM